MYITLTRLYIALFMKRKIFETSDDPQFMCFNFALVFGLMVPHLILISKVYIKQHNSLFYILNAIALCIGTIDKIIGFKVFVTKIMKYSWLIATFVFVVPWLVYMFAAIANCDKLLIQQI